MNTVYAYDPIHAEHNLPSHPENAGRLEQALDILERAGMLHRLRSLAPRVATDGELQAVHSPSLVSQVRRMSQAGGGYLDADTYVSEGSFKAAAAAAGSTLHTVEAVLSGEASNGYALVRPPGHHATPSRAMGFCLFNNVAVAARAALESGAVRRIFIADFDVHHGNGTQEAFEEDPAVFYFSAHQYPLYPGTGHWSEIGHGPGQGTVLNVPLPPGAGDLAYRQVFKELVWPLAERYAPEIMLVSAGYDGHWSDPLAHLTLSLSGYAWIQRELVAMANGLCAGRIVFALEGGYRPDVLAYGIQNALYALLGEHTIVDPLGLSSAQQQPLDTLIGQIKKIHHLS